MTQSTEPGIIYNQKALAKCQDKTVHMRQNQHILFTALI